MSALDDAGAQLVRLRQASPQQRWVRGVAGVAALGFPLILRAAGGTSHPWGWALLALFALGLVVAPDSGFPLAWTVGATVLWVASLPENLDAVLVVAAADLLVVHVACTLASYGPPEVVLPGSLLRLWAARGVLALALTSLAWLAARFLSLLDLPATGLVFSAGLLLVAAWALFQLPRLVARDGTGGS